MINDLEIRTLICKRDIEMGLNMVKSLRRYTIFKYIPIYFHDDGSLDDDDKRILLEFENSHIIDRTYADITILDLLKDYPSCKKYRFDNVNIFSNLKIKLFDFYFLSKSKNILCIDSDVLFLNEPKTIVNLINSSTPFYFPDFQNSYSFTKKSKIDVLDNVNTGLFHIPTKNHYDINAIELALNDLFTFGLKNVGWIEQSAYSHMFYKNEKYVKLNEKKHQIPTNSIKDIPFDIESLHFVGHPPIRKLYKDFLNEINLFS
jgi:hypothetical protein